MFRAGYRVQAGSALVGFTGFPISSSHVVIILFFKVAAIPMFCLFCFILFFCVYIYVLRPSTLLYLSIREMHLLSLAPGFGRCGLPPCADERAVVRGRRGGAVEDAARSDRSARGGRRDAYEDG